MGPFSIYIYIFWDTFGASEKKNCEAIFDFLTIFDYSLCPFSLIFLLAL